MDRKFQPRIRASPQGPRTPQASVPSFCQVPFLLCEGHCPAPPVCPLVARAWLKSPSASLCIDLSLPTPICPPPPQSRTSSGAAQEPHPSPNSSVEPPSSFGWCRIANSVVRCAFPWWRVGGGSAQPSVLESACGGPCCVLCCVHALRRPLPCTDSYKCFSCIVT